MLLERCEAEARALHNIAMALHVEPTNTAAVKLYKGCGFRMIARGDGSPWEHLVGRAAAEGLCLMLKPLE